MALWNGFPYTYDALTYMYDAPVKYAFLTHKFTGKERDAESGLDDFDARYYSSNLGRFVSADWSAIPEPVPYADFGDPQSLNLYTYVRNLPTVKVDANGHCDGAVTCVQAVAWFVNNFSLKDIAVGAAKQIATNTAENYANKQPESMQPSNDMQRIGGALFNGAAQTAAVVLPFVAGGEGEPGGSSAAPKEGSSGGQGAGEPFSPATKQAAVNENAAANGGTARCVYCGEKVSNEPGPNKVNIDHAQAKANGGTNKPDNAQVTCQYCNQSKGTAPAPKNPKVVKIKPPDQN
jgi:RHS repeat-associated protein